MQLDKFWVITVISNPVRYERRYKLYREFKSRVEQQGLQLFTVELQQGDRPFAVTDDREPYNLQLRTFDELWHKENMINLALARLPRNWEYVAWIDADVQFVRPDWAEETVHQLQHYMFVQMFQQAVDLGPDLRVLQLHNGFVHSYMSHLPFQHGYTNWHSGFAWACRREAMDHVGSLIDFAILGSADRYMASALVGRVDVALQKGLSPNYKAMCKQWEVQCERFIQRDVGVVPGSILHYFHGRKSLRGYGSRPKILIGNQFDPVTDLKRDHQGLWQLVVETPRQIKIRDEIRAYFRARNEDSIDLE